MTSMTRAQTDHVLKDRHRAMRAWGDYPSVAAELIPELGRHVTVILAGLAIYGGYVRYVVAKGH